jgi:hypothetical protein
MSLFSITFWLALGLTQPSTQRVPGAVLQGLKRQGREAHLFHLAPILGMVALYRLLPICLHGVVLK